MALSLSNIKKSNRTFPPRIVLYGTEKIGKSTFGANAPDPVFIFTEDGRSADVNPDAFEFDTERSTAKSFNEVIEALQALATQEHSYKTLVVDSLTFLEKLIWKHLCEKHGEDSINSNAKGSPFAWNRGYSLAMDEWKLFTNGLDYLRNNKNMAIILIAHCKQRVVSPPDREEYLQYCPDIHHCSEKLPGASALDYLNRWADAILFAEEEVFVQQTNDDKKKRHAGISTGQRVLHTTRKASHVAGNRFGLEPKIPFGKDDSWLNFQNGFAKYVAESKNLPAPETKTEAVAPQQ